MMDIGPGHAGGHGGVIGYVEIGSISRREHLCPGCSLVLERASDTRGSATSKSRRSGSRFAKRRSRSTRRRSDRGTLPKSCESTPWAMPAGRKRVVGSACEKGRIEVDTKACCLPSDTPPAHCSSLIVSDVPPAGANYSPPLSSQSVTRTHPPAALYCASRGRYCTRSPSFSIADRLVFLYISRTYQSILTQDPVPDLVVPELIITGSILKTSIIEYKGQRHPSPAAPARRRSLPLRSHPFQSRLDSRAKA
ncbi:hypothetical protein PENSPDRAFT_72436 [Peniophora sp. CONT]|nr:hypothetical protein PENSPDRAFT_72436 [Peniophora sp. CONT]